MSGIALSTPSLISPACWLVLAAAGGSCLIVDALSLCYRWCYQVCYQYW